MVRTQKINVLIATTLVGLVLGTSCSLQKLGNGGNGGYPQVQVAIDTAVPRTQTKLPGLDKGPAGYLILMDAPSSDRRTS